MYPKSPTPTEVEMLKRGYTWYGMWTCKYWQIVHRYPTPREIMEWKTAHNKRLRLLDEEIARANKIEEDTKESIRKKAEPSVKA